MEYTEIFIGLVQVLLFLFSITINFGIMKVIDNLLFKKKVMKKISNDSNNKENKENKEKHVQYARKLLEQRLLNNYFGSDSQIESEEFELKTAEEFGKYVAWELKFLSTDTNREKLKLEIKNIIQKVSEIDKKELYDKPIIKKILKISDHSDKLENNFPNKE
ncbi:hypothetical protein M0802_006089 [Mischocyttarus mexicanus]|nr:hypothetical protein M0802_006089 [Mischocyttarus mexicanus]